MRSALIFPLCLACPLSAQEVPADFGQRLATSLPSGFAEAYRDAGAGRFIVEYLPPGETLEAWQQMITVTGLHLQEQPAGDRPALNFALSIKDGYQAACPDSFSAYEQTAPDVAGAVDVFAGNLNCGKLAETGQSQAMTFLVVAGPTEIFTYQWAEQTPPWEGGTVFLPEVWEPRLQALSEGLQLCAARDQTSCTAE